MEPSKEESMQAQDNTAKQQYVLGGYEILETTGKGGMGIVYRAIDPALGRTVALKVLREDLRSHPAVVARFRREAEACAGLDHPNIVTIYSVGTTGDVPYIAMEFIKGLPLSKVLQNHGARPWKDVLDIGSQLAGALVCAHGAHIIHRDIKPANVLIDESGKAYMTDFGIAKVLTATTQLTMDGARLGTPQYMSPERCMDEKVTPASDIYALGVLLFQCMSGRLPFEAASAADLIRKIISEEPTRLSQYVPDIPDNVERLIAFMIEKKPGNRPVDAQAVQGLIERVRQGKALDDQDNDAANALASYRQSYSTPTPTPFDTSNPGLESVGARWFALKRKTRIAVSLGAVITFLSGLALLYFTFIASPALNIPLDDAYLAVDRWTSSEYPVGGQPRQPTPRSARALCHRARP
jgi:serine/threonine protein kinase